MINTLIGKKLEQSQKFLENGMRVPVTAISLPDNTVLQIKTADKDLYTAVQIGVGVKKKPNKAKLGHVKKIGIDHAPLKIREVKIVGGLSDDFPKSGDVISLETVFNPGDTVSVTGISKGKGFAGVVKRHGFAGGPKTHGQSDRHRAPGSIGQGTTPGRVYKGKRMAGRMGSQTVTVSNLVVVAVDAPQKILYVSGLVPGYKNAWVYVTITGEKKDFKPLHTIKADSVDGETEEDQQSGAKIDKLDVINEKETPEEAKADSIENFEEKDEEDGVKTEESGNNNNIKEGDAEISAEGADEKTKTDEPAHTNVADSVETSSRKDEEEKKDA